MHYGSKLSYVNLKIDFYVCECNHFNAYKH